MTRKQWSFVCGLVAGVGFVRGLAALPRQARGFSRWRDDLWEGISLGLGLGWGVVVAINILIAGSDWFYRRRVKKQADDDLKAKEASQETSSGTGMPEKPPAQEKPLNQDSPLQPATWVATWVRPAPPPTPAQPQVATEASAASAASESESSAANPDAPPSPPQQPHPALDIGTGFFTGVFTGIWAATAIGVSTTLASQGLRRIPLLGPALGWVTGIHIEREEDLGTFVRRFLLGMSLGVGTFLSFAGLNWTVEELDALPGDKIQEVKPSPPNQEQPS